MLKKVIISILLIVAAYVAFSQESSTMGKPRLDSPSHDELELELDDVETTFQPIYSKVMIIPFEPKLYISEADRDIARKTGLVPAQIRDNFRFGLNNMLWAEINPTLPAINMLTDEPEVQKDLYYMYQSIGYQYKILPKEKEEIGKTKSEETVDKVKEKLSSTFKPSQEPEEPGTRIKDGQLYSVNQTQERYMHTRVINENAIEMMANKYEAGYFVFINQFDVKIAPGVDQRQIENDMYPREIKVHYTIIDQYGQEIYGGAAKGYFPSTINDMNRIVKGHLPKITKEIASHLPNPELTKELENKLEADDEKSAKQRELISGDSDF